MEYFPSQTHAFWALSAPPRILYWEWYQTIILYIHILPLNVFEQNKVWPFYPNLIHNTPIESQKNINQKINSARICMNIFFKYKEIIQHVRVLGIQKVRNKNFGKVKRFQIWIDWRFFEPPAPVV